MPDWDDEKEVKDTCCRMLTAELPVFRKIMNLTQQELSELIGVSRQTISNIENGKNAMRWETFLALMFIFYYNEETVGYLKSLRMPYEKLKNWMYRNSRNKG